MEEDRIIFVKDGYFVVVVKLFDELYSEHYAGWYVNWEKYEITWCELVYKDGQYFILPSKLKPQNLFEDWTVVEGE